MSKSIALIVAVMVFLVGAFTLGAQQTWTGEISEGSCRIEHVPLAEGNPVLPSPECVRLCVKAGWKYVFVVGETVYTIANQDHPDLAKFAGETVKVTGELRGESLTISKIEAATVGTISGARPM